MVVLLNNRYIFTKKCQFLEYILLSSNRNDCFDFAMCPIFHEFSYGKNSAFIRIHISSHVRVCYICLLSRRPKQTNKSCGANAEEPRKPGFSAAKAPPSLVEPRLKAQQNIHVVTVLLLLCCFSSLQSSSLRGGHTMKVWILFGILACIAWQANSAALDDYQDGKNIDKIATFLEQTP